MYLVQEWIYRGVPMPIEKHEKYCEDIEEAEKYYSVRERHLKAVAKKEKLNLSFVRLFKMKKSSLTDNGWGVDVCLKITYEPAMLL